MSSTSNPSSPLSSHTRRTPLSKSESVSTGSLAPKRWAYMLKVLKEHVCSSHQHHKVKQHDCKDKKLYKEWSHDSVPYGNVWSDYWSNQNNQTNVSGHALCQENCSKKFMKLERDLVRLFCLWLFCTDEAKLLCRLPKKDSTNNSSNWLQGRGLLLPRNSFTWVPLWGL